MSDALLRIAGLSAGYGAVPVLSDIAIEVHAGEIVTLVGSNGAGKTTLLRAISRTLPARGTLTFAGQDLSHLAPETVFSLGLVQVPEGRQLFGRMTVEENLMMGAYRRKDAAGVAESFDRVYRLFPKLYERRRQKAGSMSGGEQQMCAMARALMAAPKLLVVDEMSLGLAPVIVDQLLGILAEIRGQGVTVLLVEQDVFAAFSVADRGYVMETGRIVRFASGEYIEVHAPLDEHERWLRVQHDPVRPIQIAPAEDSRGVRRKGFAADRRRQRLSRLFYEDRVEPVTPRELAAAHEHGAHPQLEPTVEEPAQIGAGAR